MQLRDLHLMSSADDCQTFYPRVLAPFPCLEASTSIQTKHQKNPKRKKKFLFVTIPLLKLKPPLVLVMTTSYSVHSFMLQIFSPLSALHFFRLLTKQSFRIESNSIISACPLYHTDRYSVQESIPPRYWNKFRLLITFLYIRNTFVSVSTVN